jgi:hypothetical protein
LAQDAKPDASERYMYGKVLHQTGDLPSADNILRSSFKASGRRVVAEELRRVDEALRGAGSFEMYRQK